jgi:SAM-dependent methyltransferase
MSERFARVYLRIAPEADARGAAAHRRTLAAGLAGTVCEVGAGPGLGFRHYPVAVHRVVAVEPELTFRNWARAEAVDAPVPITVLDGDAAHLPLDTGAADAVVFSLVMCSLPDLPAALAEARRVLRPGGEVRFYEHVRSRFAPVGLLEDLVAPMWSRLAGGCSPNRDPLAELSRAGLRVGEVRRFSFSPVRGVPGVAHVLGRAIRV